MVDNTREVVALVELYPLDVHLAPCQQSQDHYQVTGLHIMVLIVVVVMVVVLLELDGN